MKKSLPVNKYLAIKDILNSRINLNKFAYNISRLK